MCKVSVIIPVYNGEEFLAECLNALLKQTLTDIEILCIDDGSVDGSLSILNLFADKDSRVRVFTQKNAGSGPARNLGLSNATGEFVAFMDCDDYYPEDTTLEKMYCAAKENNCRIVAGYRTMLDQEGIHPDKNDYLYKLACKYPNGARLSYQDTQTDFNYQCYLFNRELIEANNIRFPDYLRCQDPPFFVSTMIAAKEFLMLPMSSYVYRWGHQNIKWTKRKINDMAKAHIDLLTMSRANNLEILHKSVASRMENRYKSTILSCLNRENLELYALLVYANSITDFEWLEEKTKDKRTSPVYCSVIEATAKLVDLIRINASSSEMFLADCMVEIIHFYNALPNSDSRFLNTLLIIMLGQLYTQGQPAYLRHQLINFLSTELYSQVGADCDTNAKDVQAALKILNYAVSGQAFTARLAAARDVASHNCQCLYNSCINTIPAVSVIVPVYNVEPYIAECLDSLLNQTCKNIEVICVNDGSTDNSLSIVMEYAQKHENFVVLSQVNSGLSAARNAGMRVARGTYLHFLDSDDCMQPDAYACLLEKAQSNDLDMLFFDAESLYEEESLKKEYSWYLTGYNSKSVGDNIVDGEEYFIKTILEKDFRVSACMYLVRKDFLNTHNLWFIEGIVHEDNYFTYACVLCAKRTSHYTAPLYIRRVTRGSITIRSKSFRHAYGYFCSYWALRRFLDTAPISPALKDIASMKLIDMLKNARFEYEKIQDARELSFYLALPAVEAELFYLMVAEPIQQKNAVRQTAAVRPAGDAMMEEKMEAAVKKQGINAPAVYMSTVYPETSPYEGLSIVQRGIACCRENGVRYTFKYIIKRFLHGILYKLHNGIHSCLEYGITYTIKNMFRKPDKLA